MHITTLMDYLNIYIAGTPSAGKSTLCNSLVGTNLSEVNTQKEHMFSVDPFYDGEPELNNDIKDCVHYRTKMYDNSLLRLNCVVNIHDHVGIENASKSDPTIKKIRNVSKMCDTLVYVYDAHTFENDIENKNLSQLDMLKRVIEKVGSNCLIVCVLNKLDSIVVTPTKILLNSADQLTYNKCENALNDFFKKYGYANYKIVPTCLKNAMFYSAGENNFFNDELAQYSYSAEINGNSRHLLKKYGLNNLTKEIISFVSLHENEIVNSRIFEELESLQNKSIENLIPILSKIRENETGSVTKIVQCMRDSLTDIISCLKFSNDTEDDTEEKKQSFEKLNNIFREKTKEELDPEQMFLETVKQMQCDYYTSELSKKWDYEIMRKLYEKGGLTEELLSVLTYEHFDEQKYLEYVCHVSDMTNHKMSYMYSFFNSFLHKFPEYVLVFNQTPIRSAYFDLIRIQLMKTHRHVYENEVTKIGFNYKRYSKIKELFFGMSGIMANIDEKMNTNVDTNDLDSKSSASV